MLGVTSHTPSQFDLFVNQSHHYMIGKATLTGTVVIQDITQANLALRHEILSSQARASGLV
tara:strand:- start:404 stop:586 length:183 start_codon:yes stop_codon:yes gene_type:complete